MFNPVQLTPRKRAISTVLTTVIIMAAIVTVIVFPTLQLYVIGEAPGSNQQEIIHEPNFDFMESKLKEGFSEVCIQELIDDKFYRYCLLDESWKIISVEDFYIYMETENFCTYRQFTEFGYQSQNAKFYDSKIHATFYGDTICGEYNLLKWENQSWTVKKIKLNDKDYFYLMCDNCVLEPNCDKFSKKFMSYNKWCNYKKTEKRAIYVADWVPLKEIVD